MKIFIWALLSISLLWIGCSDQKQNSPQNSGAEASLVVPGTTVEKSALQYNREISLWTLNDKPYSGFAVSYYPDSSLMEKFGVLDGKKQNEAINWFPDGHTKNVTNYHQGKLHGEKKVWSEDSTHVLIAQYNFHTGKAQGEQKKWYPTGELFKKMNMNRGREEGIQQAFRKNGVLFANYEARDGRAFGLRKAALCYGLEDETTKRKKTKDEKVLANR